MMSARIVHNDTKTQTNLWNEVLQNIVSLLKKLGVQELIKLLVISFFNNSPTMIELLKWYMHVENCCSITLYWNYMLFEPLCTI